MTTTIVLAVGDSDLSDALDINDGINYFPQPSTLRMPPPKIRTFRSRHLGTTQTIDPYREIFLDIDAYASNDGHLIDFFCRPIERKLEQARANSGSTPEDPRGVCLWLAMSTGLGLVYFDIDDGELTWVRDDAKTGATALYTLQLYLKCKPFARGKPVTYTLPTLTIGQGSYAYLPQLPGDAPGLAQAQMTDVSSGGVALDRYRIGTFSLEHLASSDYQPWVQATPYGAGALFADASTLNGVNCARVTLNGAYQNCAIVRQPAGVPREAGKFDVFLLCRDSTVVLQPPTGLTQGQFSPPTTIGSLAAWVSQVTVVITAVDASGVETFASAPVSFSYQGNLEWTFTWANPGVATPVHYRLYGYNLPNSTAGTPGSSFLWQYVQLPPTSTTFTSSLSQAFTNGVAGMVTQNPSSSGSASAASAVIQPYVGVVGANGQPTALIPGNAVQTVVGSSSWELVPIGMYPLPSISAFEGQSGLPWILLFSAGYLGTGTPTLDIAGVLLLKHEQPSNETRLGPAGGVAPVITTIDTNRREQVGASVASQYLAPSRTGLVAEYLMNQGSGTALTDTSGNGNNGVLQTGTGWTLDSAIAGVTGASNAITVSGPGAAVTIASLTNIPIGNAAYSIAVLVKPSAAAGTVVTWGAVSANTQTALLLSATGATVSWDAPNLVGANYLLGGWHLLIATWDGTTRRLYIDGVQVAVDAPSAHAATAASFAIGGGLTGSIGPLRIYSRALSAFEVGAFQGALPAYVGQATSIGKLMLGPGNALIVFDGDVANGVHDTTNAKIQPTILFTPRYHMLKGMLG